MGCLIVCAFLCLKGWVLKVKFDFLNLKFNFSPHECIVIVFATVVIVVHKVQPF